MSLDSGSDSADLAVIEEIAAREYSVRDTFVANDLPGYFAHFSQDLSVWAPEGAIDFTSYQRDWSNFIAAGNRVLSLEYIDMHIIVAPAGDAAVASFQVRVCICSADGSVTDRRFQETDVWFKRANQWKIVRAHYSLPMTQ